MSPMPRQEEYRMSPMPPVKQNVYIHFIASLIACPRFAFGRSFPPRHQESGEKEVDGILAYFLRLL